MILNSSLPVSKMFPKGRRERYDFDVAAGVNYGVYGAASCSSRSNSICNPEI